MATFQPSQIIDGDFRFFETGDGCRLRYALFPETATAVSGTILLTQGRAEFIEKYDEVIGELRQRGFRILAMDLRGQGLSDRVIKDSDKGHITDFATYSRDLVDLLRVIRDDIADGPLIALGHSMGGHILLRHLAQGGTEFDAVIAVAPMLGLDVPAIPEQMLRAFVEGAHLFGRDEDYMPGAANFDPLNRDFDGNKLTSDEGRFDIARQQLRENPALAMGGATIGWLKAGLRSCSMMMEPSLLQRIDTPILIASARADSVVDPQAHDRFGNGCAAAEIIHIADAKHEILFETDDIRQQFWEAADNFLDAVINDRAKS